MSPLADPEDLDEATRVINAYVANDWCQISFSDHARERIAERQIPNDVITQALQVGRVVGVRVEVFKDRLTYKYEVEMIDRYGRVTVITAIPRSQRLHIVTVYTDIPD